MNAQFTPGNDFIFRPGRRPARPYLFKGDQLAVKGLDGFPVPVDESDMTSRAIVPRERLWLGAIDGQPCWAARFPDDVQPPDDWHFEGLRNLFGRIDDADMAAAGYGLQIFRWLDAHRFCGRCGAATSLAEGDRALQCRDCGRTLFPHVSPAVIVAVISRERLLLARSGRFAGRMFSVVAGYVEPGETLEECVRREVREEVGLEIGDIRYFGSQPWPFSGSLMVGFTAAHTGGTITVDNREIIEAGWFTAATLPEIPGKMSIARQLIDWYVARYGPASS